MIKIIFFISTVYVVSAQAYLDPGTGSMLLSTIIALLATLIYSIKSFAFNFKSFIARLFGKKIQKVKNANIVIYNEGEQYFTLFYPVVKELQKRNIQFTYLYSDQKDSMVQKVKNIDAHFIDEGNKAFFQLNTLEATMCIMTTPGLDVLQIKRSKGVKHYCHLSHSTGGCTYEVFGIDYFDSILSPNIYDKTFIKGLEKKRNLPSKDIHIVGTPYLDYMLEQLKSLNVKKEDKKTILISPTWGEHGLLSEYGANLLSTLLHNNEYNLIVRPHPQSIGYEQDMLQNLKYKFKDYSNLHWDYSNNGLESMAKSDLMVSDFSGIILDYMFLFSKPVISLPGTLDMRGRDYIGKNENLWYIDFYYQYTNILKASDIKDLNAIVQNALDKNSSEKKSYDDKYNPNFGTSAIETVNAIENIYNTVKEEN